MRIVIRVLNHINICHSTVGVLEKLKAATYAYGEGTMFANLPVSTIDTSPWQPVQSIELLFTELELVNAYDNQFHRFFRVWFQETEFYAPKLDVITVVLRPHLSPTKDLQTKGITRFLDIFYSIPLHEYLEYKIYIDNWATTDANGVCEELLSEPYLIEENRS